MSQWTHVNAHIRIDGIEGVHKGFNLDENIPCGSEGSLQYKIDKVGTGLVLYNVAIWGDLRDYNNKQEIIEYLVKNFENEMIRSGIAEIEVERDKIYFYTFKYSESKEKNELIEIKDKK